MRALLVCLVGVAIYISVTCSERQEKTSERNIRFEKNWPNADDLEWFQKAIGLTEKEVLDKYGLPSAKKQISEGKNRWTYPWLAAAYLDFEGGKVDYAFYTAGY